MQIVAMVTTLGMDNQSHKLIPVDRMQFRVLASIQVKNKVRFNSISLSLRTNKKAYSRATFIGIIKIA